MTTINDLNEQGSVTDHDKVAVYIKGNGATRGVKLSAILTYVRDALAELFDAKANSSDLAANGGAGLIAWLLSAAGAVKRPLSNVLADRVSVRSFTGDAIDGVTSNQAGIVAAVAYAYANGKELHWPAGTYVSDASIANFHDVTHSGSGVIKRGASLYAVSPKGKSTQTNSLYVSTAGTAGNDGLSAAQPMANIQQAFDALTNAGQDLCGTWKIVLAAGVYNQFSVLSRIKFKNRLQIVGPDVAGGVPTAIIDGTGLTAQSLNGMLLSEGIYAQVKDIKFTNWHGGSGVGAGDASTGLNVSGMCNVWADNVHADLCGTGIAATRSRIYQGRGIISNCDTGSLAFANTTFTYGYNGATTYQNNTIAIYYRDGSAGVIDGSAITNSNTGVKGANQAHSRVSNVVFTNSTTSDVYVYTGSSCFFGSGNTYTAGKKLRGEFAMDLDSANQFYFNGDTNRFNFGVVATPGYQFHFRNSITGSSASSTAMAAFEADSPQIALNGGATGTFGLLCAIPGTSTAASWQYTASDGNWRVRANNVDSYRFASTTFRPVADNSLSLGLAANRWSVVYAGTGAINTSDAREKELAPEVEAAALRAVRNISFAQFKFTDAVTAKGGGARWHFGVIAQQVKAAFEAEGLDAFAYGLLCYDEWPEQPEVRDEETGEILQAYRPAGNRYGVRYDELLCLKLAAMEQGPA